MDISRRLFIIGASATVVAAIARDAGATLQTRSGVFCSSIADVRLVWGLDLLPNRHTPALSPVRLKITVRDKCFINTTLGGVSYRWCAPPTAAIVLLPHEVMLVDLEPFDDDASLDIIFKAGDRSYRERFAWPGGHSSGPIPLSLD